MTLTKWFAPQKKRIAFPRLLWGILLLGLWGSLFSVPALADVSYIGLADPGEVPEPEAEAAYVIETTTGICLYGKQASERLFPASTTKLMTALLIAESGNLEDTVTFSAGAVNSIPYDTMHISIQPGEQMTMEQVLHGILIASANEACMGAAEHNAGSVGDFVERMNERAKELGAADTQFANPHGLHDEQHYTTAHDLALIMREVMKNDLLRAIMSKASYTIPPTNKTATPRHLTNSNRLIHPNGQYYNERIVCGKTGFTTPAGNTLVTYGEVNGLSLIIVIMKAGQGKTFPATSALIDYFAETLQKVAVENLFDYASAIPAFEGGLVYSQPKEGFCLLSYRGDPMTDLRSEYALPGNITAPLRKGDGLGTITVYSGDRLVGQTEMVARADYGFDMETPVTGTPDVPGATQGLGDPAETPRPRGGLPLVFRFVLIALGVTLFCAVIYLAVAVLSAARYRKKRQMAYHKSQVPLRERNGRRYE